MKCQSLFSGENKTISVPSSELALRVLEVKTWIFILSGCE